MSYKYTHFIKENIAPIDAEKIVVYDNNGNEVHTISLGGLTPPNGSKLYSFCAISDVHITYDTANTDFQRALTYADANCDFTCICGDLTQNGSDSQMAQYKSVVDSYAKAKPVYAMAGNHESIWGYMTFDRTTPYTGYPLYYSFTKGNDVFIMIGYYGMYHDGNGGWKKDEFVSVEELQWLYETLEANRNKRCFVFEHAFPYDDGVGDANRYYGGGQWRTQDGGVGQAFISLLKHYKNTVLFHGHSHLRFRLQELDKKANYSSEVGYRSVHIPSLSVPRDRIDGTTAYVYAESEGYIVDVYDDYIILNGRDFIDNDADGHILPIATYKIDTTLQNIEANTFTDSTGTIIT
jgi:Icc-related predicted phosphoesterase